MGGSTPLSTHAAHPAPATSVARPRPPAVPIAELLTLLTEPDCSFAEIAERCALSVQELSLFLMSDEGRDLYVAAQSAAIMRVRLAAAAQLAHAVSALALMLMTYQSESETPFRDSPPTRKFREFQRTNARRAASLLTRLANLQDRPLFAQHRPAESLATAPTAAPTAAPTNPPTNPPISQPAPAPAHPTSAAACAIARVPEPRAARATAPADAGPHLASGRPASTAAHDTVAPAVAGGSPASPLRAALCRSG